MIHTLNITYILPVIKLLNIMVVLLVKIKVNHFNHINSERLHWIFTCQVS